MKQLPGNLHSVVLNLRDNGFKESYIQKFKDEIYEIYKDELKVFY